MALTFENAPPGGYTVNDDKTISKTDSDTSSTSSRSSRTSQTADLTFENAPPGGYTVNDDNTISKTDEITSNSNVDTTNRVLTPRVVEDSQAVQTVQAPPQSVTYQPTATVIKTRSTPELEEQATNNPDEFYRDQIYNNDDKPKTRFGRKVNTERVQELRMRLDDINARKERFQNSRGIKNIRNTAEFLTPGFLSGEKKEVTTQVIEGFLGFPLQLGAVAGEALEKGAILTEAFFTTGFDKKEGKKEAVRAALEVRDIYTDINPDTGNRVLSTEGKSALITATIGAGISAASKTSSAKTGGTSKSFWKDTSGRKAKRSSTPFRNKGKTPLIIRNPRQSRNSPRVTKVNINDQNFKVETGKANTFVTEVTQKNKPRKVSKPDLKSNPPFRAEYNKQSSVVSSSSGNQVLKSKLFQTQRNPRDVVTTMTVERNIKKRPLSRDIRQPVNKRTRPADTTKDKSPYRKESKPNVEGVVTETELLPTRDFTLQSERFVDKIIAKAVEQSKQPTTQNAAQATKPKPPVGRKVSSEETVPYSEPNNFLTGKKTELRPPVYEENVKPNIDIRKDSTIKTSPALDVNSNTQSRAQATTPTYKDLNLFKKDSAFDLTNKIITDRSTSTGTSSAQAGDSSLDLGRSFVPRQEQDITTSPILSLDTESAVLPQETISPRGGGFYASQPYYSNTSPPSYSYSRRNYSTTRTNTSKSST